MLSLSVEGRDVVMRVCAHVPVRSCERRSPHVQTAHTHTGVHHVSTPAPTQSTNMHTEYSTARAGSEAVRKGFGWVGNQKNELDTVKDGVLEISL